MMQGDRVTFLGTGDAFCAGGRLQAAYLFQSAGSTLLIDCGPGTLASLKRNDLAAEPIDTVLLSHFHGDHFAGLPFLLLQFVYVEPRTKPLRIIGPPEVEEKVMQLYRAMYADSAADRFPYQIQFTEARPGKQIAIDGFRIEAFRVPHQEHPPSYGYEIRSGQRKIVYSGDTGWTDDLVAHAEAADLFLCECSFFETRMATHLDYPRIAENLHHFGSKRMVLTHLGQEVLSHRREIELEMAHDGLVISP
jgi:ribonuclease BN (tRNA processing enzyme)